jgi:thioredoxin reductase (NADPH)
MLDVVPIGMALAVVVFAVGLALEARARKQKYAAQLASPPTLPSLYPRINSDACICTGACVTACPEGDVIAMIDGRPRLVRPSACIGHSDCLRSCPVDAIEIVLGNADRPVEVPVASGVFETTLPGVYVAGEITGMGLIHNAVAQGRQVAATALEAGGPHDCELDLVVVGAGPAGIGAALEARRRGARFVVFEKGSFGGAIRSYPRQKIVMTAPMDLPGYGKVKLRRTSKEALLELFESVVQATQLAIAEHAEVTGIVPAGEGLRVETPHGVVTARRVVLAIGRRGTPRRLGVPGDDLPHVVYEVQDPAKHAGASITIVGGGDSAAELALALAAQPRTRVTLVHRGSDFGRCKPDNQSALDEARAARRLAIHLGTTVRCVTPHHVELTTPGRPLIVPSSLVVCCLGAELPSPWLRSLGVSLRELRGEPVPRARRAAR